MDRRERITRYRRETLYEIAGVLVHAGVRLELLDVGLIDGEQGAFNRPHAAVASSPPSTLAAAPSCAGCP